MNLVEQSNLQMLDKLPKTLRTKLNQLALEMLSKKQSELADFKLSNKAETMGLVIQTEKGVSFSSNFIFSLILADALINQQKLSDKPAQQVREYLRDLRLEHNDFNILLAVCSSILAILVNSFDKKELPLSFIKDEDKDWWGIAMIVWDALPYLQLTQEVFEEIILISLRRAGKDLAKTYLFKAITELAKRQPEMAASLLIKGENQSDDLFNFSERLLVGLCHAGTKWELMVKKKIKDYAASTDEKKISVAASSLGSLVGENKIDPNEGMISLTEIAQNDTPTVQYAVIHSLARMWSAKKGKREKILKLLRKSLQYRDSLVLFGIGFALESNLKDLNDIEVQSFHLEALPNFIDLDEKHLGIIRQVDYILQHWIPIKAQIVFDFLRAWLEKHPNGNPITHSNFYLHLIIELSRKVPDLFERELIKWILDDNKNIRNTAIQKILGQEFKLKRFKEESLRDLTDEEIVVVANEIALGVFLEAEQQIEMTISLLHKPKAEELKAYFTNLLFDLFLNYGTTVMTHLKAATLSKNQITKQICRDTFKRCQNFQKVRGDMHLIKEIFPSPKRMKKYDGILRERMNKGMKLGESKDPGRTPLFDMVKKINIVGGGSMFFELDNGLFTPPSNFKEFSHTVAFPNREFVNPEGAILRRIQLNEHNKKLRKKIKGLL